MEVKNTKLVIQDINISKLPVVVNETDNKTTITVSAGTKIFFTNNEGYTEALMPVVNFKYQENNNYITSI